MVPQRGLYRHADMARLLHPASVAIVGATPRPGAFGERVLANLAPSYQGRIHLVNARYDQVGDRRCFPSLSALPEVPDCVMIAVAREQVQPVVEECVAVGAGGAIVFASGYAETGKPGRAEQQALMADTARRARLPLIGPNCIGVNNYALRARITFMGNADIPLPRPGAIGVVSQSGALGFGFEQAAYRGVSVSHLLTSGNSSDVDMADFVAYLADDPGCGTIALLFEGMAEPSRLIAAAEIARAAGKVVVACKLAVGESGAQAAMSHTGSMAGSQAAYRAAFERAGVVLVDDVEALMEMACFMAKAPPPRAAGVGVLATSGGAAIMAADKAEAHGVPMPQPGPAAQAVLDARIPEFGSTRNPVDMTAQVLNDPESVPACATAMMEDPAFGALLIPMVYASPATAARAPVYEEIARRTGKPVVLVWTTDWLEGPGSEAYERSERVALFRSMDRAYAAIAAWQLRAARLAAAEHPPTRLAPAGAAAQAATLIAGAAHRTLSEREAKQALALYGIPVVREVLARDVEEAVRAAATLGWPAVLKVESPDLPHKTEAGVIRLNLRDEAELRAAHDAVMANAARVTPPPRLAGVLVQKMAPAGVELMIGARVDPQFGPLVVVGLGGVMVELLKDSAVGLAPLAPGEAMAMLMRLKGLPLLRGFRGSAPVDLDMLAGLVTRLGEFIADHRDSVAEIDVNPLICMGADMVAVDALIVRAGAHGT
jgi:acetate---CoA ligase (ADP-forming)